jgi:hypothetical protein
MNQHFRCEHPTSGISVSEDSDDENRLTAFAP